MIGQITTGNLLPSEQLSAAGPGFVRAYDVNAVIGAQGLTATQELWAPPIRFAGIEKAGGGSVRIGGYADAGMVGNPDRLSGERRWQRTASIGAAARVEIGRWMDLRADYGAQLRTQPGQSKRGSQGFVSLTIGF